MTLEQATQHANELEASAARMQRSIIVNVILQPDGNYAARIERQPRDDEPICEGISTRRGNVQHLYTWGH